MCRQSTTKPSRWIHCQLSPPRESTGFFLHMCHGGNLYRAWLSMYDPCHLEHDQHPSLITDVWWLVNHEFHKSAIEYIIMIHEHARDQKKKKGFLKVACPESLDTYFRHPKSIRRKNWPRSGYLSALHASVQSLSERSNGKRTQRKTKIRVDNGFHFAFAHVY